MTSASEPQPAVEELNDGEIAAYLRLNPDFFERHNDLLDGLKLPHRAGGTVSLVERQVSTLRQKNAQLERNLNDLVEIAHGNEELAAKVHDFAIKLLAATSRGNAVLVADDLLRSSFSADLSVLILFDSADTTALKNSDEFVKVSRFLRVVDRGNPVIGSFKTFLDSNQPRCGKIRDTQREFLFAEESDDIGSVALVPIGEKAARGFLAIGSRNPDHFHPGKSMDFLARLGDLLGSALALR